MCYLWSSPRNTNETQCLGCSRAWCIFCHIIICYCGRIYFPKLFSFYLSTYLSWGSGPAICKNLSLNNDKREVVPGLIICLRTWLNAQALWFRINVFSSILWVGFGAAGFIATIILLSLGTNNHCTFMLSPQTRDHKMSPRLQGFRNVKWPELPVASVGNKERAYVSLPLKKDGGQILRHTTVSLQKKKKSHATSITMLNIVVFVMQFVNCRDNVTKF